MYFLSHTFKIYESLLVMEKWKKTHNESGTTPPFRKMSSSIVPPYRFGKNLAPCLSIRISLQSLPKNSNISCVSFKNQIDIIMFPSISMTEVDSIRPATFHSAHSFHILFICQTKLSRVFYTL